MYKLFAVSCILAFLFSCKSNDDDAFSIGDDFIKTETTVAILDTFTVRLSTFKLDSFPTSGTGIGLLGNYKDDDLGIVKAKSFYRLGISGEYVADTRDVFDSITVTMRYTGEAYGDTTKFQKINIYKLTQDLELGKSKSFYNTTTFAHESTPIGSALIKPEPVNDKNLEIRLNDEVGKELFQLIKDKSKTLESNDEFVKKYKGFVIDSETEDGAVLPVSLADSLFYITVYTSRFDNEKIETKHVFPYTDSSLQFNHFESDRTGTPSALISDDSRTAIPSSLTGEKAFSQAGLGMFTRVEFPSLGRVLEMNQKRFLRKAELILRPAFKSYVEMPLPESVYLYESDKINTVMSALSDSDSKAIAYKPTIDNVYFENTSYTFDITSFIATELSDGIFDVNHALLVNIANSDLSTTLQRVVFTSSPQTKYKPTLKLYYAFYN